MSLKTMTLSLVIFKMRAYTNIQVLKKNTPGILKRVGDVVFKERQWTFAAL